MAEVLSYEVLEYLESDGYQYIDTGLSAPASTSFSARLAVLDFSATYPLIGTRSKTVTSAASYNLFVLGGKIRVDLLGVSSTSVSVTNGVPFDVHYTPTVTTINGNTYQNAVTKEDCVFPFYLFQFNSAGAFYSEKAAPQRLYGFKMWHGDSLIADYVPARRDGVLCMYDKVSQSFKYNIGTGEFVGGPRLYIAKDWMLAEYEGVGDDDVTFLSDSTNEGLDRGIAVSFVDKSRLVVVERTVKQEGRREVFTGYDERFITADGGTFNSIKDGL